MRRLISGFCVCLMLSAAIVRSYFEHFVRWAFSVMQAQAPALAFAGAPAGSCGLIAAADPMIERHEAGQFRRAAARGI